MATTRIIDMIRGGARIVDVRNPGEFEEGSYPKARNISLPTLSMRLSELEPKDGPIVLFCASGARSAQAARILRGAGFTEVANAGGLEDMPR
jgi:rhodanese-related sulfurtransferase